MWLLYIKYILLTWRAPVTKVPKFLKLRKMLTAPLVKMLQDMDEFIVHPRVGVGKNGCIFALVAKDKGNNIFLISHMIRESQDARQFTLNS